MLTNVAKRFVFLLLFDLYELRYKLSNVLILYDDVLFFLQKVPDIVILKENNFQDKIRKMCTINDELYNKEFTSSKGTIPRASKCNAVDRTNIDNKGSSMSFVDDNDICPIDVDASVAGDGMTNKSVRFPITAQERKNYTVICKLASSAQYAK